MQPPDEDRKPPTGRKLNLKKLTKQQIEQIDGLLASIGDYGEVHLIVQHGEIKYVNRIQSQKAWGTGDDKKDGE